jgi:hypothetical protein
MTAAISNFHKYVQLVDKAFAETRWKDSYHISTIQQTLNCNLLLGLQGTNLRKASVNTTQLHPP